MGGEDGFDVCRSGQAVGVCDKRWNDQALEAHDQLPRALSDLPPGARATVVRVVAADAPAVARRLVDLGFTPGARVEVVRRAPLRDPVIYRIKDYEVCLRRAQAGCVQTVEMPEGE